ncbi:MULTISPECIES: single-stranded DNA-binding protein [unclassified Exiguobacterium]|uniref:single-stranded DNA-binding protein n=1 Tax=unclassified Exiguobacterium TaxID=2644629 RepID=UPI001BE8ADEF|nr:MULTISPECIES: single-stranded DNA-binding protein [unclassified Exiguobacterium]
MEKKRFTFGSLFKGQEEGTAVGYVEGWVTGDLRDGTGEKPVTNFQIVTHNRAKEFNYALGTEAPVTEDGAVFLDVAAWEQLSGRIKTAGVRKNCLVGISGFFKVEEFDGKKRLKIVARDFKVVRYPNDGADAPKKTAETVPASASAPADDDLPF